jgi:hypothetical protein
MDTKKELIDYGTIIARKDGTFVVDNYHVCPASIDPYGKYNFDDVAAYAKANPDKVIPEPEPPEAELAERTRQATLAELDLIDRKSMRYLRAVAEGTIDEEGKKRLAELEAQAKLARSRL